MIIECFWKFLKVLMPYICIVTIVTMQMINCQKWWWIMCSKSATS